MLEYKCEILKLYLETSVCNFLYADDAPDKRDVTQTLFREIDKGKYSLFISAVVEEEIQKAPKEKQRLLVDAISEYRPYRLDVTIEARELVSFYIGNGLLSEGQMADLAHLAVATVNEMDILVSWNMRHIVKRTTRTMVNALNRLYGYRELDICTPEEVVDYGVSE